MDYQKKKDMIMELSTKMATLAEDELPDDVLATEDGADIIYSASLLAYYRVAKVMGMELSDCYKHLESYFLNESVREDNERKDKHGLN